MDWRRVALSALLMATACHRSNYSTVKVDPAAVTLNAVGQTATIKATARDDRGNVINHPSLTWKSDHPEIAAVDSSGQIRALKAGKAVVSAIGGPVSGEVDVTVSAGNAPHP